MDKNKCTDDQVKRDGSGQTHRYPDALHPDKIQVDGRSIEDLLVFAKHYASLLRFYDVNEDAYQQEAGENQETWKEFFYSDISVLLASIKVFGKKLWHVKKEYEDKQARLAANPVKENLRELFIANLHHLERINRWYQRSIDKHPLRYELGVKIQSALAPALVKLIAYEKGVGTGLHSDLNLATGYDPFKAIPWEVNYSAIKPDDSIFSGQEVGEKIENAALYLDDIFQEIFKAYTQLYESSVGWLDNSLNNFPEHQPHMALFISFLELFSLAQNEINTITQKHLDYYYRDVLQLKERPANPDSVYLIYELAKEAIQYDLEPGRALTAGKDATGKELIYKTDKDLVINKAVVKDLKTIFLDKYLPDDKSNDEKNYLIRKIYVAPAAKSANGIGEKFIDADTAWPSLGYFDSTDTESKVVGTEAQIGFVIASPQLFLAEGERLIKLHFHLVDDAGANFNINKEWAEGIKIYLTSDKEWIELSGTELFDTTAGKKKISEKGFFIGNGTGATDPSGKNTENCFYINLRPMDPAISAYNKTIHSGDFNTSWPVVKIIFTDSSKFEPLKKIKFGIVEPRISIEVIVGNIGINELDIPLAGVKNNLTLYNDDGILESNKPFYPFTLSPKKGSSFYVGSKEIFNKNTQNIRIDIEWLGIPENLDTYFLSYKHIVKVEEAGGAAHTATFKLSPGGHIESQSELTVDISQLNKSVWTIIPGGSRKLFDSSTTNSRIEILPVISEERSPDFSGPLELNNATSFIDLTLVKDFGQAEYNAAVSYYNSQLIQMGNPKSPLHVIENFDPKNLDGDSIVAPKIPFAPQIKSISISYESSQNFEPNVEQFFHIYPFGETEIYLDDLLKSAAVAATDNPYDSDRVNNFITVDKHSDNLVINTQYLLPQFKFGSDNDINKQLNNLNNASSFPEKKYFQLNQYSSIVYQQGNLYIGVENLEPPQNLSLLFKIADGTAVDNDSEPPPVNWSYLVNNEWRPLPDDHVVSDSTYGLQATGIILIDFPEEATKNNTIITNGLHWLCISVDKNADRLPKIIDIIAQANSATFFDLSNTDPLQQNDPEHYRNPLPKESISKMVVKAAEVKKILQPFESFDNKMREEGGVFYSRISERLRHKARAITPWDYEHLVLENFPGIYKVKCITHTDPDCVCRRKEHPAADESVCCCGQVAPGHVLIVPISNLRNKYAVDNLKPRTGRRTLLKIREYLYRRVSPFVHLQVLNPKFEEVKVSFQVKFNSGIDKGFYLRKLNEDIIRHLTPWAFDASSEIAFGGKVYASIIINFIEERDYVDFITCFKMIHIFKGCCKEDTLEDLTCDQIKVLVNTADSRRSVNEIDPTSPYGILISVKQHCIELYKEEIIDDPCQKTK